MKFRFIKTNIPVIQKICLTGLFIALSMILQKVIAVNYIAAFPFVRLSFGGPALIMFASILLGPVYGALVGAGSDLLGYIAFDIKAYPLYPQITAIYLLLGFLSYFVFSFVTSIKNRKLILGVEIVSLSLIWIAVSLFVVLNNEITVMYTTHHIDTIVKILVPSISGLIFAGLVIFSVLYKGKDENPVFSPLHICFASFICDFFILVLFGSTMKALSFGTATFMAIILCQALVMFFNVMLDTMFISIFQKYTKKYFCGVYR